MSFLLQVLPDILIICLYYIYIFKKYLKNNSHENMIRYTLLYLSIFLIILFTLHPFLLSIPNLFNIHDVSYNFEAFVDWKYNNGQYISETIFNILLFMPFGFTFYLATKKRPLFIILCGLLLSTIIEIIQPLIIIYRVGDITDIINNTFGVIIGVTISYLLFKNKD